ncbi:TPA: hypothetical protein ACH3X1_012564 [Trebouxia sp. C0004]
MYPVSGWFKAKERPVKQIRSIASADHDTGTLDIQSTSYYKAWNPELPQQQQQQPLQDDDDTHEVVEQAPDELNESLQSMYEACDSDWTDSFIQQQLDIALHYDITNNLWDRQMLELHQLAMRRMQQK